MKHTDSILQELLKGVDDPAERRKIERAWSALDPLEGLAQMPPRPGAGLAAIFKSGNRDGGGDELCLTDLGKVVGGASPTTNGAQGEFIEGTSGDDSLTGGADDDTIMGEGGDDTIEGEGGDDILYGDLGDDTLSGGVGDDSLYGGSGDDTLSGGEGRDSLFGGQGADELSGGEGDDLLSGARGADTLSGGAGDDTLIGGGEGDTFVFGSQDGDDVIMDFNPAFDRLDLQGAEHPHDITVTSSGGETVITFGDTTITLQNCQMSAEDVWNNILAGREGS